MTDDLVGLRYKAACKTVLNKIARFRGESLLQLLLARLYLNGARAPSPHELLRAKPWMAALLVKWVLTRGSFGKRHLLAPTEQTIDNLLSGVASIEEVLHLPSQHDTFQLFFRSIAYQQFWYQEAPQRTHVARQAALFADLDGANPLATRFREAHGLPIRTFIELCFAVTSAFLSGPFQSLRLGFFAPLIEAYSAETFQRFVAVVSREPRELRALLRDGACVRLAGEDPHEYRERTPLLRYPLLRVNDVLYVYSLPILIRGLETIIYDLLRAADPSWFMTHFGAVFEQHVGKGVAAISKSYLTEAQLRSKYGRGKVVDFAMTEGTETILIDAKGVEMSQRSMVTPSATIVTRDVENSIIKGLTQAQELATRMNLTAPPFVVLVTYKHLFLGAAEDFARYADSGRLKLAELSALDMSKVFFVSIEEFDYLASGLATRGRTLSQFLSDVGVKQATREGRRMMMAQHINDALQPYSTPAYLEEHFETLIDRMRRVLPESRMNPSP